MNSEKLFIGRNDFIDLPEFHITNIKAKIDTGAYTSSIHCQNPRIISSTPKKLAFSILDGKAHEREYKEFVVDDFSERDIKNSFGQVERRFIIKTTVLIFNRTIEVEFSLSDRSNMKHPILLGRKFLQTRFVVDVSKFNLSYKEKRKRSRNKKKKKSSKNRLS